MNRLLLPTAVACVLLVACGGGHGEDPAPLPIGEPQGTPAAQSYASELDRCRVDLDARRDTLIQLYRDLEELKAGRSAALSDLEKCYRLKAEAEAETERLKCFLAGKSANPSTLRCEGADLHEVHITTP